MYRDVTSSSTRAYLVLVATRSEQLFPLAVSLPLRYTYARARPLYHRYELPTSSATSSLTSFHGRGFFPGTLSLDDFVTLLASIEAVIGLLIEIIFIATFTQRFFAR